MLDYRAWMIAGAILLTAAGAYVIWITRPRAVLPSRSLSASGHNPNQPITSSLHVEGCNEDFIVKPGELVEPRVVPGASLDQFRSVYGKESKREDKGIRTWDQEAFSLANGDFGAEKPGNFVQLSLNRGHVVETLDGVELGIDSFGTIFRKMRDKKVEVHERIDGGEGNWTLIVSFYSACGHKFRSEYSRMLPGSPDLDKFILPQAATVKGQTMPWRSDVFMNKVVYDYTLVPSNGTDESIAGSPSEHD